MKYKLLAATAVVIMAFGTAQAENKNNVGCGFGSEIFKGQSGTVQQSVAVTTNGTSSNQTFGITSGTSGCTSDGVVDPPQQAAAFTGANLDKLALDTARGEGESLKSLAELMGIEEQDQHVFFQTSQRNFSTIFASENTTADAVLVAWYRVMAADEVLHRYAGT
jgi:Protein of unknown function (DUF3015)